MEQDFQTSFIPKKPMLEERAAASRPVGLLTILSIFIFISVVLATGGLYLYKGILSKNILEMKSNLNLAQGRLERTKISELQLLDTRLRSSSEILRNHIAISPIFNALTKSTLKNVRYTKFSYDLGTGKTPVVNVKMTGQAVGYRSIALQADIFSKTAPYLIDPVFSNLSLDDKTSNVLFDLAFSVDPTFVDYKEMLATQSSNTQN
ncbi:MAG: hypothetical protein WAV23_00050 [Minisyncoccia bacterium]